jgi:Family of unknown function (DUF6348)
MNPNDWLSRIMEAHGVRSELHDESVVFPDHGKRGYARLFPRERTYQLDVGIEIFPGWTVLESFAGFGTDTDTDTALKDAFHAFARGTLHVILVAFFDHPSEEQVTCEEWDIAGAPRRMTLGNVVFRGATPVDSIGWFPQFEAVLKSSALPNGTHWVRLYYAQIDNKAISCEALLDNEPWPELQEAMAHFAWPAATEFYSARLFLTIQGGVGLAEACAAICRKDNPDAIGEMVSLGATAREATLLYSFVTLAFGRELTGRLGVTTSGRFVFRRPDGQQIEQPLATEPLFMQAAALAHSRSQLSKDQFACIAMQSCEIRAVNKAMNSGSHAADLVLTAPMILLPE